MPLDLNETFLHFDTLIWQVPSIAMAVGVGAVVAASQIENANGWLLSLEQVRGVVLLLGAFLLVALTIALVKYRIFAAAATPQPLPEPPFRRWPRAARGLPLSTTMTTGIVLGFSTAQLFGYRWLVVVGVVAGFVAWRLLEKRFDTILEEIDKSGSVVSQS
ncbi:MAG TPA: hypothetical protein VJ045_05395 [Hyphomicrobiaceae bacterium]|nr:hypothetical protein [Hyphomicrobiaceae bacterium]